VYNLWGGSTPGPGLTIMFDSALGSLSIKLATVTPFSFDS